MLKLHQLSHQHNQLRLRQHNQTLLIQIHLKLLRLKLHRRLHLQRLVLRNLLAWVHRVVQFLHLQVVVVQFLRLLVAQVEHLALVVHLWAVVLRVRGLVLVPAVFLKVHLVAVQ